MSDKVREAAYDAWTRTVGVSNAPGGNLAMSPLDAWRAAWKASRAAALEEAAKVCEGSVSIDEADEEWNDACDGCADAIRALAGRGA